MIKPTNIKQYLQGLAQAISTSLERIFGIRKITSEK